jgi:LacI family transcriptional regulator
VALTVTLKQVAEAAGVSPAAASLVLSGNRPENFTEVTRQKIHAAAERLGYRPNLAARSTRMKRSFLVGVLVNASNAAVATEFLRGVQAGLRSEEASTGCSPIVFSNADPDEQYKSLQHCIDYRVDGLILNAAHDSRGDFDGTRFETLVKRGLPAIEVFGHSLPDLPRISVDNRQTGQVATEHLLALGHRTIPMLTHERYQLGKGERAAPHIDAYQRFCGYEATMRKAGLEPIVVTHPIVGEVDVDQQFVDGGVAAYELLTRHPARPTAVVCYNDYEAYGLIRGARLSGTAVPERLSVVGFANLELSRIVEPALTTVPMPGFEVGQRAAQAILDRIDGREVKSALIESDVVVRESTRVCGSEA